MVCERTEVIIIGSIAAEERVLHPLKSYDVLGTYEIQPSTRRM